MKPLKQKNYGSIPHLSSSKLGIGDHYISIGQEKILLEKARDSKDQIFSFEKYDGSNVGICKVENKIHAITRSGYLANTSPYKQHHLFSEWVSRNEKKFSDLLNEGERICGEWMIQIHSLEYELKTPIIFFDKFHRNNKRSSVQDFLNTCDKYELTAPRLLATIIMPLNNLITLLSTKSDFAKSKDLPEGIVFKCERNGGLDFMAKWVRSDFEAGSKMDQEIFQYELGEKV